MPKRLLSHLTLAVTLVLGGLGWAQSDPSAPEGAPAWKPDDVRAALADLRAGKAEAVDRLAKFGPTIWPVVEEELVGAEQRRPLEALTRRVVFVYLEESARRDPGVRYHGQFDALKPWGEPAAEVLMEILLDEDRPVDARLQAAGALGDIQVRSVRGRLKKVLDDFLTESWLEREVGFLLARLGDREYVDEVIAAHRKVLDQEVTSGSLPDILEAHAGLSEVYYRVEEFDRAVVHYQSRLTILRDLMTRIDPELRPSIHDEINVLHYNLACSLARSGQTEEALAALRIAIESPDITWSMIREDGDLTAVRKLGAYQNWEAEAKKASEAKKKKREKPEPSS